MFIYKIVYKLHLIFTQLFILITNINSINQVHSCIIPGHFFHTLVMKSSSNKRFFSKSIHLPHFLCNILCKQGKSLSRHCPDHIAPRQCPLILNYSTPATNARAMLQPLPNPNDLFLITNNVYYYLTIIKTASQDFLRYFTITPHLVSTYYKYGYG